MRQHYQLLFLLFLCVAKYEAQDPTTTTAPWYGDPKLCTVNPSVVTTPLPLPAPVLKFPTRAEFTLERIQLTSLFNITGVKELTMFEYIYDYNQNILVRVANQFGILSMEYHYFDRLKMSRYFGRDYCQVENIPTDQVLNGNSAVQIDGKWHIRPFKEFILFSSDDPTRLTAPTYLGRDTIRGIEVDKWENCLIDTKTYRTVKRTSYFARQDIVMPGSTSDNYAIPVRIVVKTSLDFPNNTQITEDDEVFNFLSFRPGITETLDQLATPKGVFCDAGPDQALISLSDINVNWPNHFNVRVDTSTSQNSRWQRFHLRYSAGRDGGARRLRYDFIPPNAEDYQSVIHDYSDNLTYTIDRRIGTCTIKRGVEIEDVSPIRDPIRFFIKHEAMFIFSPPEKAWEFNGFRSCRGSSILCTILTAQLPKFPPRIDPDTGVPSGDTWEATFVEYGWSSRTPRAASASGLQMLFDYPVSLYLKMFRFTNPFNPTITDIKTEDIEYEFYEMSHERHPTDFDTSICYRSLGYKYSHLVFSITPKNGGASILDNRRLNRRVLELQLYRTLMNIMNIKFQRISEIEIEHEFVSNSVQVFFTLLDQTPRPGSESGFADDEPTVEAATSALKSAIENDLIEFDAPLTDGTNVTFKSVPKSLSSSKQYTSSHVAGTKDVTEKYTSKAIGLATGLGLVVGIIVGILAFVVFLVATKRKLPTLPISVSNPLPSISFKSKASSATTSASSKA